MWVAVNMALPETLPCNVRNRSMFACVPPSEVNILRRAHWPAGA